MESALRTFFDFWHAFAKITVSDPSCATMTRAKKKNILTERNQEELLKALQAPETLLSLLFLSDIARQSVLQLLHSYSVTESGRNALVEAMDNRGCGSGERCRKMFRCFALELTISFRKVVQEPAENHRTREQRDQAGHFHFQQLNFTSQVGRAAILKNQHDAFSSLVSFLPDSGRRSSFPRSSTRSSVWLS